MSDPVRALREALDAGFIGENETPLDAYGKEVLREAIAIVAGSAAPKDEPCCEKCGGVEGEVKLVTLCEHCRGSAAPRDSEPSVTPELLWCVALGAAAYGNTGAVSSPEECVELALLENDARWLIARRPALASGARDVLTELTRSMEESGEYRAPPQEGR